MLYYMLVRKLTYMKNRKLGACSCLITRLQVSQNTMTVNKPLKHVTSPNILK